MIPFFEGKDLVFIILTVFLIPLITYAIFYSLKSKQIWKSILINIFMLIIANYSFYPFYFQDLILKEYESTTFYWLLTNSLIAVVSNFMVLLIFILYGKIIKIKKTRY